MDDKEDANPRYMRQHTVRWKKIRETEKETVAKFPIIARSSTLFNVATV